MQYKILLPYSNYAACAGAFTTRELNRQIISAYRILRVLVVEDAAGCEDPRFLMWKGFEHSLKRFAKACFGELHARTERPSHASMTKIMALDLGEDAGEPLWLGNPELHEAHRNHMVFLDYFDSLNRAINRVDATLATLCARAGVTNDPPRFNLVSLNNIAREVNRSGNSNYYWNDSRFHNLGWNTRALVGTYSCPVELEVAA